MLTRRTFLIAAALSPLAKFCRTEPTVYQQHMKLHPVAIAPDGCLVEVDLADGYPWIVKRVIPKSVTNVRYALPPGTLG